MMSASGSILTRGYGTVAYGCLLSGGYGAAAEAILDGNAVLTRGMGQQNPSQQLTAGYGDWARYDPAALPLDEGRILVRGMGGPWEAPLLTQGYGEFSDSAMDAGRVLTNGYGDRAEFLFTRGYSYLAEQSSGRGLLRGAGRWFRQLWGR